MGMLINGRWHANEQARANEKGDFVRPESAFRAWIHADDERFTATSGRYHLIVNAGCPWAYRTILYRAIKGLTPHLGISFTEPAAGVEGWTFGAKCEAETQATHIHQIYTLADPQFTGRATVPVLWDKHNQTIVNNESADIIRMLNSAFNALPGVIQTDYYPRRLAEEIDELNDLIYNHINNGVYQCGFARTQAAYNKAFDNLFSALDLLNARLCDRRFLCGDAITEPDWRLFATLLRFDAAYHGQFKCNRNPLTDFSHLWPYTRDLYQQPHVAETVDIAAIKGIYYGARAPGILPKGPALNFDEAHTRHQLNSP